MRERVSEHMKGVRGRGRRKRISSRLHAQCRAWCRALSYNPKVMHDLSWNQEPVAQPTEPLRSPYISGLCLIIILPRSLLKNSPSPAYLIFLYISSPDILYVYVMWVYILSPTPTPPLFRKEQRLFFFDAVLFTPLLHLIGHCLRYNDNLKLLNEVHHSIILYQWKTRII